MITNLRLDLTDRQRNDLACMLAGKKVARLATRAEITDYVTGLLERSLCESTAVRATPESPVRQQLAGALSFDEQQLVEQLRAAGKNDSYIRGYIKAGRPGARA
ncbi:MAG: hypothetical protein QNI96_05140 [Woeseiaceae bacterium]|nr:hypothetical protein [Woeseiaceae bacterium]